MEKIDFSSEAVTSEAELREMIGVPHDYVLKKSISIIDDHCKRFIAMSPLLFLSTSNANGTCTVSPRGDLPSEITIINDTQLIIPDRPGNKRLDSFENILSNPHVGLVFLIPGLDEVLRINGKATIIKNSDMLDKIFINGKTPMLGIGVDVEECFIHCSRALKKSRIWNPDTWQNKEALPSSLDIFHAHLQINGVELKK